MGLKQGRTSAPNASWKQSSTPALHKPGSQSSRSRRRANPLVPTDLQKQAALVWAPSQIRVNHNLTQKVEQEPVFLRITRGQEGRVGEIMLQWPAGITTFSPSLDSCDETQYIEAALQHRLKLNCRNSLLEARRFDGLAEAEPCIDELRLLVAIQSCSVLLTVTYLAPDASYPLRYRVDLRGFCRASCARHPRSR